MKLKVISLIIIVILLLLSLNFFIKDRLIDKKEVGINLNVGNHIGFNVDNNAIYFGTIIPGNYGSRNMTFVSDYDFDVKIKIKIDSEFKDWYEVSDNNFILKKNEEKEIIILVNVPLDAEMKEYNSTLNAYFWKTI